MRLIIERNRYKNISMSFKHFQERKNLQTNQSPKQRLITFRGTEAVSKNIWEAILTKNQTFSPEMIPMNVSMGRNKNNLNNKFKTPPP
ncbi:hypothetical protein MXB_4252, partial [Myxobolus squamalis]